MRLIDLDNGSNSISDLLKKFQNTVVELNHGDSFIPVFVENIDGHNVLGRVNWKLSGQYNSELTACEIRGDRPAAGIYNLSGVMGVTTQRPIKLVYTGNRQWARGVCQQNVVLSDIKEKYYDISNIELAQYTKLYNPVYPSVEEALTELKAKKYKHVALSPNITLMRGNNRFVFLRNFIPFLTCSNGMVFKIPPLNDLFKKDCDYYEHLFRTASR